MKNQKRWNLNFCSALHQSYTKAASKYLKKKSNFDRIGLVIADVNHEGFCLEAVFCCFYGGWFVVVFFSPFLCYFPGVLASFGMGFK